MRYSYSWTYLLLASGLLLLPTPLSGQQTGSPKNSWREWSAANRVWLQEQVAPNRRVPNPHPTRRRLLLSYDVSPEEFPYSFTRSATYDNALAALAFFITGETDAAAFTLHAMARLIRPNGGLWFSYNTGNTWPDEGYHESAIVRAGAVAWVGYAFTFYLAHSPPCAADDRGCARERDFFLRTAVRLANHLSSLQVVDTTDPRYGLLRLGYATIELEYQRESRQVAEVYLEEPALGISAENNISAWFFLRQLAELTEEPLWSEAADRIRYGLLRGAWNDDMGQFNRGFHSWGEPDPVKALDCASWGVAFLLAAGETEKAGKALEAVERYYRSRDGDAVGYRPYSDHPIFKTEEVGRHFFPDDPRKQWRDLPLVWSEGTLGVALAYLRMGQTQRARQVVEKLRSLQVEASGMRYASRNVPYQMAEAPSVAASAWLVLVTEAMAGNPLAEGFFR
ncbi:MAG: hypothetical protein V3U28_10255 [Candidatus Acidoferrales bacterium]